MANFLESELRRWRSAGVQTTNGTRHLKLTYNGRLVGILPHDLRTADRRAFQQTRAQLRRAGVAV